MRSPVRVGWVLSIVFLGALPLFALFALFAAAIEDDLAAMDFQQFYRAAEAILRGDSPYPLEGPGTSWGGPYPYPPFPALASIPLTVLPIRVAEVLVMAALVVVAVATLYVLGVRDWRCYGVALVWPPVLSAIQTGNVTLLLGLGAAITWRFRDRPFPTSAAVAVSLAVKLFLWPLVIWFAATRRIATAVLASTVGAALLVLSWAAIGFAGLVDYPDRLQRLESVVGADSYTMYIVGLDLGLPSMVARVLWLAVGFGILAALVTAGRRGDERTAFILALAAALALTPIIWLHYFALLLVVVALVRPTLGVVWFVPLAMVVTPGSGQPTPFETSATLAVAAVTFALALREDDRWGRVRRGRTGLLRA